jgi:pimeloyl-ACP methyl ester carboxylesterase
LQVNFLGPVGMVKETRIATAIHYTHQNIGVEGYQFSTLAHQNKGLTLDQLQDLHLQTGLTDLYWRALYYKFPNRDKTLAQALVEAEGYVFFLHGWDGTHRIWEDLPLRLTGAHQRLVCFNFDVNGFGLSPFINDTPTADQCAPAALMAAIEFWLATMKLWPIPRRTHPPFYLFVGHSMGAAALFYKSELGWRNHAYGLYPLAPALFCNDSQQQAFFKTVGLGIGLPSFAALKTALAPHIMEILAAGASPIVKNEHVRVFARTPFGTLAQTLYVLGDNPVRPQRSDWPRFRVALGQKDRLVRVENMLQLLDEFGLQSEQIRITPGDHYFFSYGDDSPPAHKENREALLDDLLAFCRQLADEAQAGHKDR